MQPPTQANEFAARGCAAKSLFGDSPPPCTRPFVLEAHAAPLGEGNPLRTGLMAAQPPLATTLVAWACSRRR